MARRRLQNYLRMYRKRSGLTQDEVAYLLGYRSGSKISRCEHFWRVPSLVTALTYEVIFRVPVRELFAGTFDDVERKTIQKIGLLAASLHNSKQTKATAQKLETLAMSVRKAGAVSS